MAKKNKDRSLELGLIAILFFVLTPLVLFIGWVYYKWKSYQVLKHYKPFSKDGNDMGLSEEEFNIYQNVRLDFETAQNALNEIEECREENGIPFNQDGSISARSNLGKKLRDEYEYWKPIYNTKLNQARILENLPNIRWEKFNQYFRMKQAFFYGGLLWVSLILFAKYIQTEEMLHWLAIPSISALVTWLIYILCKKPFAKYTPEPSANTLTISNKTKEHLKIS